MKPMVYRNPASGGSGSDPTDPEAIVRVVLEKSPLLVYIANLDFKIVLANRALREVTGYDTGDCPNVEALIERFYPHGDAYAQRVRDIHEGWKRNEHIMGAKLLVQGKDGTQRTIAWYTSRLRIGRSPTIGYIAMGLDLTTQGTLEQWVGLLQRTLQHLAEGVVLTDATGSVLAWNAGAAGLLGHSEEQMQGAPLANLFVRGEREIVSRSIDAAVSGEAGRFEGELELVTASGTTEVLAFTQVRLDGEGGVPLARLTVLAPPGGGAGVDHGRVAEIEAELRESMAQRSALEGEVASLMARVSSLDASLATSEAAAGQIADLRGQLHLAEEASTDAKTKLAELQAELKREREEREGAQAATSEKLAAVQEEAGSAAGQVEALEAKVAALEKEAADAKAAADAARAAADAAVKDKDEALAAAKKEADEAAAAAKKEANDALAAAKKKADDALAAAKKEANDALAAAKKTAAEALAAAKKDAEDAATAAKKDAEDALTAAKKEADEALTAAKKEAEDAVASARKEAEEAGTSFATAKAAEAAATAKVAQLEKDLGTRSDELKAAQDRLAELESLTKDGGARLDELKAKLEEAEAALDKAEEDWGNERARIQEGHRDALEALTKKAAADRKTLEEQLHKDILAAEERAEVELQKVIDQHAKEKRDLEQAAEISQAEIESAAQQSIQEVRTKLDQFPSLEDHVGTVAELAVISADTSGRVLAWSKGAAALDGRVADAAVGKVIHEDVLQLDGVAWKSLFGKIMIQGKLEQEVTLITAAGARRQVELRATLVKNSQGAPVGLTEVIRLPEVGGGLQLHAAAALGRLVAPVREMLDVRTLAGLASSEEAARAARGLVRLGQTVVEGASLADVERVARSEDLGASLDKAEAGLSGQALSWREIRMTLQDLELLEATVKGDRIQWRWNELVERCLHASGADRANRQYGDAGILHGSGEAIVPMMLSLFVDAPDHGSGLTVATGRADGRLTASVVGRAFDSETQRLVNWLAGEAGGEVTFTGAIAKITLPAGAVFTAKGDAPALLSYDAGLITEVAGGTEEEILAVEAEEMEDDELELELDEAPTGPVDDRATLEMAGLSDADVAAVDEDDLPSDHPVLASGSVDLMEEGEDDELMLMAGEDSIIKSADVVYMAVKSIDDADPVLGDSTPVLARRGSQTPDMSEAPIESLEEIPGDTVPAEAAKTDSGDGALSTKSPPRKRKRKRKRSSRKKK